jgi:hypothetical protein
VTQTGRTGARLVAIVVLTGITLPAVITAQTATVRRTTTIEAIHEFPNYFHLQNVLVRGEFVAEKGELVLRADSLTLHLINPSRATGTTVEARGQLLDVGKLDRSDGRLGTYAERFRNTEWPRPGTELALNITSVTDALPSTSASVRALSLEPSKYDGQTVTVLGDFHGRNLFGDLPQAPGKSKYDFVLTAAEGAIWVTGLRPRGKGFDLDVDRRQDSTQWLEVTGVVSIFRGFALLTATKMTAAPAPNITAVAPEPVAPPPPSPPVEVVFSAPTPDDSDVSPAAPVRIQFSRGLKESTLANHVRVTYVGGDTATPLAFKTTYDGATRALQITFTAPLIPYRTVKVELSPEIQAFDGAALKPWSLTFSVGRQ